MKNYIIGFILGVIATLIVVFLSYFFIKLSTKTGNTEISSVSKVQIDTVFIEKSSKPIYIQAEGKIKYYPPKSPAGKADTSALQSKDSILLITQLDTGSVAANYTEFISRLDTIFKEDTINIQYKYPQNFFMLQLQPKKDSMMIKQIVVTQEKEKWWLKPTIAVGSCVLGILVGRSISK